MTDFASRFFFLVSLAGCSVTIGDGTNGGAAGTTDASNTTTASSSGSGIPLDCEFTCPGPHGVPTQTANGWECVCPAFCSATTPCADGFYCVYTNGACGADGGFGQCSGSNGGCFTEPAVCGCDGNVYPSGCAAQEAGVSPTAAPVTDCAAERVPCDELDPSGERCFAGTQWCSKYEGDTTFACQTFANTDAAERCTELTCDCLLEPIPPGDCTCTELASGLVVLDCSSA